MNIKTAQDVTNLLLKQVLDNGESIWESCAYIFDWEQEKYLDFLVKKGYITEEQKENWNRVFQDVYNRHDSCDEYTHIEAMTYATPQDFPCSVLEAYELENDEGLLDIDKAKELDLINVPVFIETENVKEHNEIYWNKVIPIMAEYMFENLENYKEFLEEI